MPTVHQKHAQPARRVATLKRATFPLIPRRSDTAQAQSKAPWALIFPSARLNPAHPGSRYSRATSFPGQIPSNKSWTNPAFFRKIVDRLYSPLQGHAIVDTTASDSAPELQVGFYWTRALTEFPVSCLSPHRYRCPAPSSLYPKSPPGTRGS